MVVFRPLVARMVCLPTGAVVGASCVLFYQSGRRSRHPRVPSTGKASILSCEFLLFSRTNSRALGKNGKRTVKPRRSTDARNWPRAPGPKIVGQDSNLVIECLEQLTMSESCR